MTVNESAVPQDLPCSCRMTDRSHNSSGCGAHFIEWYHKGEERTVEVAGMRVSVKLVARKGRRVRVAVLVEPEATLAAGNLPHSLSVSGISN